MINYRGITETLIEKSAMFFHLYYKKGLLQKMTDFKVLPESERICLKSGYILVYDTALNYVSDQ